MELLGLILIICMIVFSTAMIWLSLPGSFIMVVFIFLWAWIGDFGLISLSEVIIVLGIMVILEILELGLSGLTVRYTGAEKHSAYLAIIGGMLGTIILGSLFLIVGAIIGLFIGSYLGAFLGEHQAGKDIAQARRAAFGALLGTIAAKVIKSSATVIIGIWMINETT